MQAAVSHWADRLQTHDANVIRVGFLGSYARGDWGPGSDVDLVILVAKAGDPLERSRRFDTRGLPVPADVLVFTNKEWDGMKTRRIRREPIVWVT